MAYFITIAAMFFVAAVAGENYDRPLQNFGFQASRLTPEENDLIESLDFVPTWCKLYKTTNDHGESANGMKIPCKPALFGMDRANIPSAKLRLLAPRSGCGTRVKLSEYYGDEETDTIIAVAFRGQCTFLEKAQNAAKTNAKALIIVDNQKGAKLIQLIASGKDENVTVPIPVVSAYENSSEPLSINGYYMNIKFGQSENQELTWQEEESVHFWDTIVKKFPTNPKYKMRLAKQLWRAKNDLNGAEALFRDAIDACLPKDPRAIYAYFYLGVLLAEREGDFNAWKEAASFLPGYKKYQRIVSQTLVEHLLNKTRGLEEEGSLFAQNAVQLTAKVFEQATRLKGGKDQSEPIIRYNFGRFYEYVGNYTGAMEQYEEARTMGIAYNAEDISKKAQKGKYVVYQKMKNLEIKKQKNEKSKEDL
jgi:tetratricopeptide (TPR) repeat protein